MREIVSLILIIIGTLFMIIAGVGIVRLPDLYLRMSATTKAATVGAGFTLIAVAVHFGEFGIVSRAIAIIIFLLATAPIAAHMIGRAAYFDGVPLWEGTAYNELKGRYDEETHVLTGLPDSEATLDAETHQ